jgi:hypothetical protein
VVVEPEVVEVLTVVATDEETVKVAKLVDEVKLEEVMV